MRTKIFFCFNRDVGNYARINAYITRLWSKFLKIKTNTHKLHRHKCIKMYIKFIKNAKKIIKIYVKI